MSLNDRCLAILEEIKQFSEQEEASKCVSLEALNPQERAQIYEAFETDYDELLEYEKQSVFNGSDNQVVLIVKKRTGEKQSMITSVKVDDVVVHTFRKYTKLSLPLATHHFIDYYLDCLDPYTGCRSMFSQFMHDIETHKTISKLNTHIEKVINSIITYMKEHPSVDVFKNTVFGEEMNFLKSSPYKTRCDLYNKLNQYKLFISVDINKATFSIIKHYHPDIFRHLSTWEEFALSFCDEEPINILKFSKAIRERIFGNVNFGKRIKSLAEYFVHKVVHEMNISPADVLMISTDEVVLSYDQETFRRMFDRYHGTFFKVQAFRLVKLPKYDYFVKEYFDTEQETDNQQIEITHREFKCVPVNFIMQCIKQYEGKPILEVDRKFAIESGQVATFDEPIFKSSFFYSHVSSTFEFCLDV
jgi:glycerol-3-phosphate cytidylyltransferase-like family protein